ncbi:hypothetical protein CTEN210_16676 [Chaetoceros tenuissimus]|uniref:CRAL-TRIO domain-containing protein n=1 Tax=Chaetoceros tenuissimus TaxID=426638 RepID=A0AAD3HE17_9STRA|nr:hypothetical protein CTEN210_16676 [Chaetoceros tenuissimus]
MANFAIGVGSPSDNSRKRSRKKKSKGFYTNKKSNMSKSEGTKKSTVYLDDKEIRKVFKSSTKAERERFVALGLPQRDMFEKMDRYFMWRREMYLDSKEFRKQKKSLKTDSDVWDFAVSHTAQYTKTSLSNKGSISLPRIIKFSTSDADFTASDDRRVAQVLPGLIDKNIAPLSFYAQCVATYLELKFDRKKNDDIHVHVDVRQGVNWPNLTPLTLIPFTTELAGLLTDYMPNRLYKIYVYPLPTVASPVWSMYKALIGSEYANKVEVFWGESTLADAELPEGLEDVGCRGQLLRDLEHSRYDEFISFGNDRKQSSSLNGIDQFLMCFGLMSVNNDLTQEVVEEPVTEEKKRKLSWWKKVGRRKRQKLNPEFIDPPLRKKFTPIHDRFQDDTVVSTEYDSLREKNSFPEYDWLIKEDMTTEMIPLVSSDSDVSTSTSPSSTNGTLSKTEIPKVEISDTKAHTTKKKWERSEITKRIKTRSNARVGIGRKASKRRYEKKQSKTDENIGLFLQKSKKKKNGVYFLFADDGDIDDKSMVVIPVDPNEKESASFVKDLVREEETRKQSSAVPAEETSEDNAFFHFTQAIPSKASNFGVSSDSSVEAFWSISKDETWRT